MEITCIYCKSKDLEKDHSARSKDVYYCNRCRKILNKKEIIKKKIL